MQFVPHKEIEKVDWAEPENEIDEEVMQKVKVLFVRNLMSITTEEQIRSVFESLIDGCDGGAVERVKKSKDYAFVHFRDGWSELFRTSIFQDPAYENEIRLVSQLLTFARFCQTSNPYLARARRQR